MSRATAAPKIPSAVAAAGRWVLVVAVGSLSADAGAGALIGVGVGALGGYLYDQHVKGNI